METVSLLVNILLFFVGASLASCIGVFVTRGETYRSTLSDRSKCDACAKTLSPLELIPVVSWLFARGKCGTCKARISFEYTLAELVLGTLYVLGFALFPDLLMFCLYAIFVTELLYVVWYDLRTLEVPTLHSSALVILSVVFAVMQLERSELGLSLIVAGVSALFVFALHVYSKGRLMGLADTPVVFALSLFVGINAISGLVFSFWIGAVIGIVLVFLKKLSQGMKTEVPFVPFLAAGYLLAFFTGWNLFSLVWMLP